MKLFQPKTWPIFQQKDNEQLSLDRLIQQFAMVKSTVSGEMITPKTAMAAPTVFAIVNRISRAVAMLPFGVERDVSEPGRKKTEMLPDHPVTTLLNRRPNVLQTPYEYWTLVCVRLLLYGVFYAEKRTNAQGELVSLMPIHPDHVQAEMAPSGRVTYRVTDDAGQRTLPLSEDARYPVVHNRPAGADLARHAVRGNDRHGDRGGKVRGHRVRIQRDAERHHQAEGSLQER